MYSEAFHRYRAQTYRTLLYLLLEKMNFLKIPEIQALGRFCCVDGSVFPAIITMTWAAYQQKRNAIKLHLAFELNRMIPTQFLSTKAIASERRMLLRMLEAGLTYMAIRAYVSFNLFLKSNSPKVPFIIRPTSTFFNTTYKPFQVRCLSTGLPFSR